MARGFGFEISDFIDGSGARQMEVGKKQNGKALSPARLPLNLREGHQRPAEVEALVSGGASLCVAEALLSSSLVITICGWCSYAYLKAQIVKRKR